MEDLKGHSVMQPGQATAKPFWRSHSWLELIEGYVYLQRYATVIGVDFAGEFDSCLECTSLRYDDVWSTRCM